MFPAHPVTGLGGRMCPERAGCNLEAEAIVKVLIAGGCQLTGLLITERWELPDRRFEGYISMAAATGVLRNSD